MHCGVMVTGYNQGDWERLLREDYSRPPTVSDAANMDDTLYMGELVEPFGFDSIWATEHYGSAYSMQPNPLQYLAYWAGRTSRVDMGTAVIVAPWWNPVRLAHEIAMLDILLQGRRLHLGIGRGIAPHEYASLGYPMAQSHQYFYEVIQILRAADGAERFAFDGDIYKIPPTTIRPQARHKGELTRTIKAAFSTPDSMRLAAEHGLTLQRALSLEMLVVHVFYGGIPRHKAAKSLRLFAKEVLPVVQAMPTPINLASLGETER